ncbi:hypothetical protein EBS02_01640 [bacterium]|nr:hypothetical protein [bacterium]
MKKIIFGFILLVGFISLSFLKHDAEPLNSSREELFGIDVSHYQGTINWSKVSKSQNIAYSQRTSYYTSKKIIKKTKVKFCFIKATEGSTFVDKKFKQNLGGCVKYKIPRTGYHYYRFNSDPKKQARNFINNVPKSKINLPPTIDIEYTGNESLLPSNLFTNPSTKKIFVQRLTILSNELEKHYGQKPIFYTTPKIYATLIRGNFPDNPIWICELKPVRSPNCDWLFWQTSFKGEIEGITYKNSKGSIENLVDVNKFNGGEKDLQEIINRNRAI